MNTKEELALFRKYCGKDSIVTSTHLNQSLGNTYPTVNKNIQINTAKLRDFLKRTSSEQGVGSNEE